MLTNSKIKQWLIILAAVFLFTTYYFSKKNDNLSHLYKVTPGPIHEKEINLELEINQVNSKNNVHEDSIKPPNFVKTYQGTQPDGAIQLDEKGQVIIDKGMKRLFDYYLSAIGELPFDQMRKYLKQFAEKELNRYQLQQLLDYFDQYHNYLNKADIFSRSIVDNLSLQKKMNLLSEFRANSLGKEMAKAFFAEEHEYIKFVMTEKNSDEFTRKQQDWLQAENQATEFQDVMLENREFNNIKDSDSIEVNQYRVEKYGQEIADRLSLLDQQRAQWQTIVDEYFVQRQQIESQESAVSLDLLNSNYSTQEIRRLEALWRIQKQ